MALKLIRTDQDSNSRTLSQGSYEFGRGVFLDCDDKRVSRCHGRLEVGEDNQILLSALHKNPCFVTVKDSTEIIIMTQGMTKELSEGDKFGLLPTAYWYQLTKIEENDKSCQKEAVPNTSSYEECEDATEADEENPDSPLLNFAVEEELDNNFDNQASPSLLGGEAQNKEQNESTSGHLNDSAKEEQHSSSDTERIAEDSPSKLTKRLHSPDGQCEDIGSHAKQTKLSADSLHVDEETLLKKVKEEIINSPDKQEVEPVVKSEAESVKVEPGVKTEPVKQDPDAPSCSNNSAAPNPTRERCMYGAQCFRRNPIHKQQFSHPDDEDWGAGDKAPCPWGSSCARRDPRHWRDHSHPPGTTPPDPNAPRASRPPGYKKRNKKKRVSSDEEDELVGGTGNEEVVKLPAKRIRRTAKRISWSGSESENDYDLEDPFLTDGSDDWQPSE